MRRTVRAERREAGIEPALRARRLRRTHQRRIEFRSVDHMAGKLLIDVRFGVGDERRHRADMLAPTCADGRRAAAAEHRAHHGRDEFRALHRMAGMTLAIDGNHMRAAAPRRGRGRRTGRPKPDHQNVDLGR